MKVYILRSVVSSYVFEEVMETEEFYLARLKDGIGFDIFAKSAFSLTVEEAMPLDITRAGFNPAA